MTSLFFDLARNLLASMLVVYTVIAVGHYVMQLWFAHRTYRRQRSATWIAAHPDLEVSVDIVIPVYNEEPGLLEACLASALAQDHRGPIQVIVVDDGSPNRASLDGIYDRFDDLGVRVVRSPRNVGKRHAQALALPFCQGEILLTLDSDSVLAPDAVRMLTRQFADPKVGAATGMIDVSNRTANLLTRIQRVRYWMAFNQERAAQTWFRTVMCCSGPLAAYRRTLVEAVKDAYLGQRYGGVACTYGDDRHLTNLILSQGYDTVYDSAALAWTNVPTSIGGFLRQQLRWNKSFYRELIWTVPFIGSRPFYSRFDLACQVAMPVMLTVTAGSALVLGVLANPVYIVRYLALIAGVALLRATYAVLRERDLAFYLFILYGYVSAFLLVSVRFRALATLTDARWGTRGPLVIGRAEAAVATLMDSIQPLRTAVQAVGWPEPRRPRAWVAGSARLDGAWRAGLRTRMMAHPIDGSGPSREDPAAPAGLVPATVPEAGPGARDEAFSAEGWALFAAAPAAVPEQPLRLEPRGRWVDGPSCRHAVAAATDAPFCRACGAPRGRTFRPDGDPVTKLASRLRSRRERRAVARAALEAIVAGVVGDGGDAVPAESLPAPTRTRRRRSTAPVEPAAKAKRAKAKPAATAEPVPTKARARASKPAGTRSAKLAAATPTRSPAGVAKAAEPTSRAVRKPAPPTPTPARTPRASVAKPVEQRRASTAGAMAGKPKTKTAKTPDVATARQARAARPSAATPKDRPTPTRRTAAPARTRPVAVAAPRLPEPTPAPTPTRRPRRALDATPSTSSIRSRSTSPRGPRDRA